MTKRRTESASKEATRSRATAGAQRAEPSGALTPSAFQARQGERDDLVAAWQNTKERPITTPAVLTAMRRVPRHAFIPPSLAHLAYLDTPLSIGLAQTISQPYIVALMTQMLDLQPTDRVLEVGTGSGYQAAILAEVAAEVFSVEVIPTLHARATQTLRALGYGPARIHTRCADGYAGWPDVGEAPFDAIIVTAAPEQVPSPLLTQLAPGGRLVIPVGDQAHSQQLQRFARDPNGTLTLTLGLPVRFVPMTGRAEPPKITP
jgi:protein-L-isoaspartate(D-aspartate) O-methyltransferase